MSFVHLHVHSHYSLLDGFGAPKNIAKAAKEQGSPAIALTDHGNMYGAIEFYKACKDYGVNPIIGCECYVAPNSRFDKTPGVDNKPFHVTLLASSYVGYQNLMALVTKANLEGFYYKPRIDHGLMKSHSEGLIALSGCLAGEISKSIINHNDKHSRELIKKYQDIFGKDNFYLELQHHPEIDDQKIVNEKLIELSKEMDAPLVASTDAHYIQKDDAKAQDILLCIQTQSTLEDEDRMKFSGDFSLKTPEEMDKSFAHVPDALENTVKIAEKCNVDLKFGQDLIPIFKTPQNAKARDYLRELCYEGLKLRYGDNPGDEAKERLEYELGVVDNMGFNDYFLIVWDFVKYAKDKGITVGPGRGSAAGSLITYCLDITELDPLKYGLIFERFLNPERVSMPDIDIDFADIRRDEVLEYVREKYGHENVAQIITFGTMAARAAVRDVGRAMGYPYAEVDRIAKLVPPPVQGRHVPLKESVEKDPELMHVYKDEPRSRELLDNAMKLEGTVRHAGTHACAAVMSEEPLVNYTPMQKSTGANDEIITQYSMKYCEEIGLLKMDFLGLKNLTIIQRALEIIKAGKDIEIDMQSIPMDDKESFRILQKGDTTGVFQLESSGMRRYIRELKPTCFEDIIAMISLYRPGPMEWIPGYIKAKHNPETIRYFHSSFESILKETNGVAIYQEQILQIARQFAGFSLGEADILRKAVGKKNPALLQEQRKKFVDGAVANNHEKKFADDVFEKVIEPFAGYGFNKAHAACYAMISYRTAYLKAHYRTEFMAALLSADAENTEKVVMEINECEEMGISVLPPSINESYSDFTAVKDNVIRFGLNAIKGLGANTVDEILLIREKGKFKSLEDLLERVPVKQMNKKTIQALAYSGALDDLGERKAIALSYEEMTDFAKAAQRVSSQGQTNIFGSMADEDSSAFNLKKCTPATFMERLTWEKDYLGLYVSGHPLRGLKKYLSRKVSLLSSLTKRNLGKRIVIGGLLTKPRKVFTKSGSYMMYAEIEDPTGRIEIVFFPNVYNQYQSYLQEDKILILEGKIEVRGQLQFICQSVKSVSLETMIENAKATGSYDESEKVEKSQKINDVIMEEIKNSKAVEEKAVEKTEKIGNEDVSKPDKSIEMPFIIDIPKNADAEMLRKLKGVLTQNKGERSVEFHIPDNEGVRKIKIPFGIEISEELEDSIKTVLGG